MTGKLMPDLTKQEIFILGFTTIITSLRPLNHTGFWLSSEVITFGEKLSSEFGSEFENEFRNETSQLVWVVCDKHIPAIDHNAEL